MTLLSGILDEPKLREFPFAPFAAKHWYHYYERSQEGDSETEKLVARLFQDETNCLATWVRLYDIQNPLFTRVDFKRRAASPLYYAAFLGLGSIVNSILAIGTRFERLPDTVNAQGGDFGNALQAASANGHKEVVQMLLNRGADVNTQGELYGNALQAASANGDKEVVQMILDRGTNVNGNALQAAAMVASLNGRNEVAQMLRDRRASLDAE